ncbi:MAG: lamin tail domain-containing protein, partial [Sedimentisphaerales bacterium]|nr:lamin tail domain-containing protein [Sedimentisphaerales bacterium]
MRPSARTHLTGILLLFVLVAFCGAVSPKGDIDGNNSINSLDLAQLADRWLAPECEYSSCQENLDGVDGVNSRDLAILAEYWGAKGTNLVINEFMARNKYNNYAVVQGQVVYPDWLEIHNPGPDEIYLGGWYLTDNEKKLRKWPLPRRYLGAGGHMLIFASGIELEDHPENLPYWDGSYYHTNFTLGGDGGYLALVDPHEYIIHEYRSSEYGFNDFGYPQQYQDVSYGLYNGVEQYLPNPSPRAANYPGYERMSGVPYFSHPGGTFVGTLDLSLTHPAQGSVIRYTTNGTVPSETSTEYTGPIPLVYTTEVIARVFEPGKAPGPFVSKTYVGLSSAVSGFNSNIPIVVVDTKGQLINDSMYTRCFAAFMEKPVSGGRVNITDSPDFVGRCGIRIRGSSTAGEPKHQYSLETWDE